MATLPKGRGFLSLAISIALHGGFVALLALIPARSTKTWDAVDLSVSAKKPAQAPAPDPEPDETEEPPTPEPDKPPVKRPKKRPKKAAEAKEEPADETPPPLEPNVAEDVPQEAPEAPPVFDLGDNTFAKGDGQAANWSLRRSEGNTRFAPVAKQGSPSVRGTRATGDPAGKPGGTGTGYAPVPIKDLSQRPLPRSGTIAVPPYPADARREGIEGAVVLQVYITRTGAVRRVRVIKDPGGGLGDAAKIAMLKEKWTPPLDRDGQPVDTIIIYSYRFVLDG
ncbi:MAG: energy transducer TonB [Myxococcota bacterium]|nr:energy transducer TonB [Myxococcota bacterium]